jgi:NAD(P)-dependent dehydrogenase (short-subunit alcohol dehydrogenase family)
MIELANQVAIISGGLGDIGRACAVELARRGADVAVGDIKDDARIEPLRAKIEALGRRFLFNLIDVADPVAVNGWVQEVERVLGVPNLVIPNAAIVEMVSFDQLTPAIWQRHLDVNLSGAMHLAHAAAKRLIASNRPGRIVLIGSWAAESPHAHIPAYCVAKAGLRMLCRCMALEYAPHDILVNEVAPGFVNAGLSEQIFTAYPERRTRALARVPLNAFTHADEVAFHVAHLCDPRNRSMTGGTLLCDGGLSQVTAVWRAVDGK